VTFVQRRRPYTSYGGRDIELDSLLETPHNEPFENTANDAPFWRLMILTPRDPGGDHTFTASFIFHHAICDGTSGLTFHKDFLAALNTAPKLLKSPIIKPPTTPLLPPLEKLHPFPVSCKKLLSAFFVSKFQRIPRGIWAGGPVNNKSARRFQSLTLTPHRSSRFFRLCKEKRTTVQATLQTLVATCLFQVLPDKFTRLKCLVPVSLKRWFGKEQIGEDVMGVYLSGPEDAYSRACLPTDNFSWDEARRSRETVAQYLENKGRDDVVGLFRYIGVFERFCWSKVGRARDESFEVSNIGKFKPREVVTAEGDGLEWKMGRVVFSQSAGTLHAAVCISVVTGADGGLTLGFAWQERVVQKDVIEGLIAAVEKMIGDMVNGDEKALPDIPEHHEEGEEEEGELSIF
jgi:hypothetical protein